MLKTTILSSIIAAAAIMPADAQTPKLGVDPIEKVINAMTLDEKLDMLIGTDGNVKSDASATIGSSAVLVPGAAGQLNGIPRLGIPATVVADGPAGLRISPTREGTQKTFYCTHFPIETVMSSTWNTELVRSIGAAMGDEVKHYGVDVLLAPATNIHRNPLNGRNFEYYSEDPLLSGKICAAMVNGVQSNGVGTSLKHFALNNQETNRTSNNVIGTPRTFREIYLKPFEIVVKEAQPWTIMTSYNKINGTMASERCDLVTEILRHEWGFKGMVMTDWYGGQHATMQMEAGNDLLMPGKLAQREELRKAVLNGHLSMEIIDRNVKHVLEYIVKTPRFKKYVADNNPDLKAHAQVTRNAALEGMVLLKNLKNTLPLSKKVSNMAVFGRTSYDFIAGGTGSGDVNHAYVVSLIEGLQNAGFNIDNSVKAAYEKYIPEATEAMPKPDPSNQFAKFLPKHLIPEMSVSGLDLKSIAKSNDVAIITIGKTSGEFADRYISDNFNLTDAEKNMINDVCTAFHKAGKKVVVILNICGVIETASWISGPDAVLTAWLPGQEGGNSVADIITGKESPSGRLPMTWPVSYDDVPSKADFPYPDEISDDQLLEALKGFSDVRTEGSRKNFDYTEYNDGIYVGYRYYATKGVAVSYPFGYGLSYTTFKYGTPDVSKDAKGNIKVSVEVKNSGKVAGKEVVQVYVAAPGKDLDKPARELKGFAKTKKLNPGESQTVEIDIPYESLASFNETASCWQVESGDYTVMVANNVNDAKPLTAVISEEGKVTETVRPCLLPEQK
ncbi:MAG: glycoside hydrolase family 3 C-terminal domain-containing protein [Prevotellaceae bacterium]|nr:glycoside hydrolase family 3 C-terminal domain-containing protein [Prevotellaceae bacterium]